MSASAWSLSVPDKEKVIKAAIEGKWSIRYNGADADALSQPSSLRTVAIRSSASGRPFSPAMAK